MSDSLTLCLQLYDIITESPDSTYKIIQLLPPTQETSSLFVTFKSDENTLEIGLSKKTYLAIFKGVHGYWHSKLVPHAPYFEKYWLNDRERLMEVYYMTLGYLLTTNENHTIIRLHEIVFWKIWAQKTDSREFLVNEFELLTCYVTSRLKRINKSSSLWCMVKKITAVLIFHELLNNMGNSTNDLYELLINRVMKSCDVHFANYYAANFLRWCIRFNFILTKTNKSVSTQGITTSISSFIEDRLVLLCRQKYTDVSLWTTLEVYQTSRFSVFDPSDYVISEYNMIIEQVNVLNNGNFSKFVGKTANDITLPDIREFNLHQLDWLLKANCSVLTPYTTLIRSFPNSKTDVLFQEKLSLVLEHEKKSLSNFEKNNRDGNPIYESKSRFVSTLDMLLLKCLV